MKVVALAGGTGSAKLLRGLARLRVDLTVVANTGDNFWAYGVYVCPDIDIATYTLAGISDRARGWGIEGDTFAALGEFAALGFETWFRLGDRDLAVCLSRTAMMRDGASLTDATRKIAGALGARHPVLPVADDPIETRIITQSADFHLQEFWVRDRGRHGVLGVRYEGARKARPTEVVATAMSQADRILLCPANPVTSIGPMLAVGGFRRMLRGVDARVVALSPMDGRAPFSGPAGKLLRVTKYRPDSLGVASLYADFLDTIVISRGDLALGEKIERLGLECLATETKMRGPEDELRLAKVLLGA